MGGGSSCHYPLKPNNPLEGMFSALKRMNDGDITKAVDVTTSSNGVRCMNKPSDTISGPYNGEWSSNNEVNSWIRYDLKNDKKFILHGYAIKTYSSGVNGTHMKSWKLEGSNDGFDWVHIDTIENSEALNSKDAVFTKSVGPTAPFSAFRITMTDKNYFGTNTMTIANVEFFGNIA